MGRCSRSRPRPASAPRLRSPRRPPRASRARRSRRQPRRSKLSLRFPPNATSFPLLLRFFSSSILLSCKFHPQIKRWLPLALHVLLPLLAERGCGVGCCLCPFFHFPPFSLNTQQLPELDQTAPVRRAFAHFHPVSACTCVCVVLLRRQ